MVPLAFVAERTYGLVETRVNLKNLCGNWRRLVALARREAPMAVVKADAYGHGVFDVAAVLAAEGCRVFAAGSVAESVVLRSSLARSGWNGVVLPLLGVNNEHEAAAVFEHSLTPLVHSARQIDFLRAAHSGGAVLDVAVKVESGMSRLGVRPGRLEAFIAALRGAPFLRPVMALSHFAAADDPNQEASVAAQVARFGEACAALRQLWPGIVPSIANSAAYLAQNSLLARMPDHIGRPGYALYGGNPFAGTRREGEGAGFAPVMEASAPVLSVHDLPGGMSVSYGRTFTAPHDMRVAIVGAGYADGFPRTLSSKGHVCIQGEKCAILGRVCMQMHIVDVSRLPRAEAGDEAYILGGGGAGAVGMEELAAAWGTIPYEIFCALGKNRRAYVR